VRMDWKADLSLVGEVSVGKVSMTLPGEVCCRFARTLESDSGRRARRATARLPCEGWERMRAMPVPCQRTSVAVSQWNIEEVENTTSFNWTKLKVQKVISMITPHSVLQFNLQYLDQHQ
jgi:hypothetical protein